MPLKDSAQDGYSGFREEWPPSTWQLWRDYILWTGRWGIRTGPEDANEWAKARQI